jgi:hypothetical protein
LEPRSKAIGEPPAKIKGCESPPVEISKTLDYVWPSDYEALALQGTQIDAELLRVEPNTLTFMTGTFSQKVFAAVSHAPPLLIQTGIAGCGVTFVQIEHPLATS